MKEDALHLCGLLSVLPTFDWRMEPVRREIAIIAYHFHWSREACMEMSRAERAAWLEEIRRINRDVSRGAKGRKR